ncbi:MULTISPECIES: NAD/NADP-dependent octopine/nopaline dehydrogenase family protein [Anaerotruncus]|nr:MULTISPECIES: NAD/NADP-dependent octopine/nopaline dehydrogenase family protein [Anaerotruncus]MBC3938126.1 NAD/NADP octopine/nopaline dehydrogenase family protein [Anaerotruncus massiliensis (ex Togo et al. 2019)]MCQ4896276.1 NAD/NADP octopine/nopaline dehydrogenase family protein [Anaerotruncus sp. DFI.9.16]
MDKLRELTIVGAGNGGKALAGDLANKGWDVNLFEVPEFIGGLKEIMEKKEITVSENGVETTGKLKSVTTDIAAAVKGQKLIVVVMPGFGHKRAAELIAPHVEDGQIYLFMPGGFGSFEFMQELKKKGAWRDSLILAETATLPYGTFAIGPTKVMISVRTVCNPLGVYPASRTDEVFEAVKGVDPAVEKRENLLDVAMCNLNPTGHVVPCLMSVSQMEGREDYCMYRHAFTPSVKKLILSADAERVALREKLGLPAPHHNLTPGYEMALPYFGEPTYLAARMNNKGPNSVSHRYVTEDAPYGLALYASIAHKVGVDCPITDALLKLAGALNDSNYTTSGRTLESLGLADTDLDELMETLNK